VSYWTIAQTLATKSRFWLEDAVTEIIIDQVSNFGRKASHVYSHQMLKEVYLEEKFTVADLGKSYPNYRSDSRPWRPPFGEKAYREINVLIGEQEREHVCPEQRDKLVLRRTWDGPKEGDAAARDREQLKRVAAAAGGSTLDDVAVQCNLLIVEPANDGKPHVFAFRFVNHKTVASHAQRKQERVNLLRLYAYLVQQKLFCDPEAVHVCVAELHPRLGSGFERYDRYPDYFSPHTYWISVQLWEFIGVPSDVVSRARRWPSISGTS
jgi:hypothetical protein